MFGYDINDEKDILSAIGVTLDAELVGLKKNKTFGGSDMFVDVRTPSGKVVTLRDHVGARWDNPNYAESRRKEYLRLVHARDTFRDYHTVVAAFLNANRPKYRHMMKIRIVEIDLDRFHFEIVSCGRQLRPYSRS